MRPIDVALLVSAFWAVAVIGAYELGLDVGRQHGRAAERAYWAESIYQADIICRAFNNLGEPRRCEEVDDLLEQSKRP